jgi:hypothetical protein
MPALQEEVGLLSSSSCSELRPCCASVIVYLYHPFLVFARRWSWRVQRISAPSGVSDRQPSLTTNSGLAHVLVSTVPDCQLGNLGITWEGPGKQSSHYNRTFSKERKSPQSTTLERTAQLMSARPCEIAACQQLLPSEQSSDDPWCQATVCRCDPEKSDRLSSCAVPLDRR